MAKQKRKQKAGNNPEIKTICPGLKGAPENLYVSAKFEKVKRTGHKLMKRRLILRKVCSEKIAKIDASIIEDPVKLGLLLMKFDRDLLSEHNLIILSQSSSPELRKVAVEYAQSEHLFRILAADENPEVLARLIDKVEDPQILKEIIEHDNLDESLLEVVLAKALKNDEDLDLDFIEALINSSAITKKILIKIAKITVDPKVLDLIFNSEKCTSRVLRVILAYNISFDDIVFKVLRHRNTISYLWVVAAKYSRSPEVWKYCAKSKHKIVLRTLSKLNRAASVLAKNKYSDYGVLFDIITKNPRRPALLKTVLRHSVARKNDLLWLIATKVTKEPDVLNMIAAHNSVKVRSLVAKLKAEFLSKRVFQLLLHDKNKVVKEKLMYHKSVKIRIQAVKYSKDDGFIAKVSRNPKETVTVMLEIVARKVLDLAAETALARDPRIEVRKALAKRQRLYQTTHNILAGDKSKAVLKEYAKRKDITSPKAIQKIAGSVHKEIQLAVIKNNPRPPVLSKIGVLTPHASVVKHILDDGRVEIRRWIAGKRVKMGSDVALKLAQDKSQLVKVSLLQNRNFIKWFRMMLDLAEMEGGFITEKPTLPVVQFVVAKFLKALTINPSKQLNILLAKELGI